MMEELLAVLREAHAPVHVSRLEAAWSPAEQRDRCLRSLLDDGLVTEVAPGLAHAKDKPERTRNFEARYGQPLRPADEGFYAYLRGYALIVPRDGTAADVFATAQLTGRRRWRKTVTPPGIEPGSPRWQRPSRGSRVEPHDAGESPAGARRGRLPLGRCGRGRHRHAAATARRGVGRHPQARR